MDDVESESGIQSACNADYHVYSANDAGDLFKGRDLYIWGAGQKGRGFSLALERNGFRVKAFLDSSPLLAGTAYMEIPILNPYEVLNASNVSKTSFILVASVDKKNKEIFGQCQKSGLLKGRDFINIQQLAPFYPTVEVSGVCNLRCISCPRGSSSRLQEQAGFMSSREYSKVIRKLIDEIPFLYLVDLYMWGDPLLNPELPEIIRVNKELGIASGISTNLNYAEHLEDIVKTAPAQIRVSVSGYGAQNYEVTHTGGKWEKLYNNLILLSELIKKYEAKTIVEIYYHVYNNNHDEARQMQEYCLDQGFRFHPVLSMLFPDFVLDYCEGIELSSEASKAEELMLIRLDKLIKNATKDSRKKCLLNRVIPIINWDMSVMPCCNYSYHKLSDNYLDISLNDIIKLRANHYLCQKCQKHALHRYFNPEYYADLVNTTLGGTRIEGVTTCQSMMSTKR